MATTAAFRIGDIRGFLESLFKGDVHAKRVYSLADATLGVMRSASLAIHAIGQGLAQARGRVTKHAVKQVDRLLSNPGIHVWTYFRYWVTYVVGPRQAIMVALDWTDFDADAQATVALNLVTRHGRATPLLWMTVDKFSLKDHRNEYEDKLLARLQEVLPEGVKVTVLADRGFGDHKLFAYLVEELGFDYLIRIRGNIHVTDAHGIQRPAKDWVGQGGRAKTLRSAQVTAERYEVPTVVCVQAKDMKEPWCLCASDPNAPARELIRHYARRWGIESHFRDTKDLRFGMGLARVRIHRPERRDRLLLLSALAVALLTLLGAAGESLGLDRLLKANTVKHRTHSLFRQGCMWYDLLPNMPEIRLKPLIQRFGELLHEHRAFREVFAVL
jgi:hypothetical protein